MFVLPCLPSLILVSKAHTHFLQSLPGVTVLYHITRMPEWGKHFLSYLSSSELPDKTTTNPSMKLETAWTTVMWGQRDRKHMQLHSHRSGPCCFSTRARATVWRQKYYDILWTPQPHHNIQWKIDRKRTEWDESSTCWDLFVPAEPTLGLHNNRHTHKHAHLT